MNAAYQITVTYTVNNNEDVLGHHVPLVIDALARNYDLIGTTTQATRKGRERAFTVDFTMDHGQEADQASREFVVSHLVNALGHRLRAARLPGAESPTVTHLVLA